MFKTLPKVIKSNTMEALYWIRSGIFYLGGVSDTVTNRLTSPKKTLENPNYMSRGYPVLLLHGLAHNQSWSYSLQRQLKNLGFQCKSINYPTLSGDITTAAEAVSEHILQLLQDSEVDKVHVVAHSLGGLVLRAAVANNPELGKKIASGVTIGTPHNGTPLVKPLFALLPFFGPVSRDLLPGSPFLQSLDAADYCENIAWVCVWSPDDEIVPGNCGQQRWPRGNIRDFKIPYIGHLSLMYNPLIISYVISSLIDIDNMHLEKQVETWLRKQD